jgi:hypothetical protein
MKPSRHTGGLRYENEFNPARLIIVRFALSSSIERESAILDRLHAEEHPSADLQTSIRERTRLLQGYDNLRRALSSEVNQNGGLIAVRPVAAKKRAEQVQTNVRDDDGGFFIPTKK